jgi:SAM-dependent methyltransferase
MNSCPVCESKNNELILQRLNTPVNQCSILSERLEANAMSRGDLTIQRCQSCGFVFNSSFDKRLVKYDETYNNINLSSYYDSYILSIVQKLSRSIPLNGVVVEVGCGQGLFLQKLCEYRNDIICIGYDPSFKGEELQYHGRLKFEKTFLEDSLLPKKIDVVVCRHVIEHISNPREFLSILHNTLSDQGLQNVKIIFETPCNEWIINNRVYWDFFYEHCSIFSAHSIWLAFQLVGFQPQAIDWVFEGQYLWIESFFSKNRDANSDTQSHRLPFMQSFDMEQFVNDEKEWCKIWMQRIESLPQEIGVIGAGAKGVTFVNLFDPYNQKIVAVVDVSPQKKGKFIPGSGHEIIGYEDIVGKSIKSLLLLNPNYYNENLGKLQKIDKNIILIT